MLHEINFTSICYTFTFLLCRSLTVINCHDKACCSDGGCINNPWDKHLSQTAYIIHLLGSIRSCGTCFGNSLLWTEGLVYVCVCVCVLCVSKRHTATGMELQCLAKGAPSVFPLPWSRSQGVLGSVSRPINFSCISEMAFGGISMLSLGGAAPVAPPTRPWELPLPCLLWGDLFQC